MTTSAASRGAGRIGIGVGTAALLALSIVRPALAGGVRVGIELPVPPKISTLAYKKVLVARFVSSEHVAIDPGREFVRFVRRELAKGTNLQILDVDPPALPEQPVEDLIRNATFWKHIAEEFGADLVVSGHIVYSTADRSGFVQQDDISPITGQKVRHTVFAEREEHALDVNLWFFKGANGAFLYEDTFRDSQIFDGKSNDALEIFYGLSERMIPDLVGILAPQRRRESRFIFDQ